jgi:transcriptional regulator with XRE-family HTH domain
MNQQLVARYMDLRQLFATNLRRIRHERKLSQERLARDSKVDRAYLSRVERAVTYVGLEIIEKLANVLDVDPTEFFRRPASPKTPAPQCEPSPSDQR